jgi:hypothetical protein
MNTSHLPWSTRTAHTIHEHKGSAFSWSGQFQFALTLWKRRCRFLEYPELKLFSNQVVIVGRKN